MILVCTWSLGGPYRICLVPTWSLCALSGLLMRPLRGHTWFYMVCLVTTKSLPFPGLHCPSCLVRNWALPDQPGPYLIIPSPYLVHLCSLRSPFLVLHGPYIDFMCSLCAPTWFMWSLHDTMLVLVPTWSPRGPYLIFLVPTWSL